MGSRGGRRRRSSGGLPSDLGGDFGKVLDYECFAVLVLEIRKCFFRFGGGERREDQRIIAMIGAVVFD